MIDTVILKIPWGKYAIMNHKLFSPSTKNLRKDASTGFGARGFTSYKQNPTKTDYKSGNYKPRLTITPRYIGNGVMEIPLKIEFSVPKLIFGNNVDEVDETCFELVIETLREKLKEMGIEIFPSILKRAIVSNVHFSKNIILSKHLTANQAIKELAKLDVSQKLDLNRSQYRNGGHAIYFYAKSHSLVIYDKMKDLSYPRGRAIDSDKLPSQLELFQQYKEGKLPIEILRFEARLTTKQKLNSIFKLLGFKENPCFADLFNNSLSQKVINYYWNFIYSERYKFVLSNQESPEKLFKLIIEYHHNLNKKISTKNALALLGVIVFAKDSGGRGFRNSVVNYYNERTWFRVAKNLDVASKIMESVSYFGFVEDINKSIKEFKPFRTEAVN